MARKYNQGFFKPKFPEKYKGDVTNIVYRSGWECKLMSFLDIHPDIIQWSSETVVIPYVSPLDNRIHRYFVDFWVKKKTADGKTETVLIEVKPASQSKEPEPSKKKTKRYINEVATWAVNQAKWKAAREFCEDRNWKFQVFTEKELGIK